MNPSNPRSIAVDAWKSLAIFGVVWIHCGYLVPHEPALLDMLSPLFQFCVPMFVLFWAAFAERGATKPGWTYLEGLRRAGHLVVLFLAWSTLYWLLKGDFVSGPVQQITRHWSGYGWSGQYFFLVLLQLIVLFPLLRWMADRIPAWVNITATILLLAFLSVGTDPSPLVEKVGDRIFPYWVPYAIAGIHLGRRSTTAAKMHWGLALLSVALVPLEKALVPGNLGGIGPYLRPSIALATFVIGYSAISGSRPSSLDDPRAGSVASWISRRTLGVFCLNPLFVVLSERFTSDWTPIAFPGAGVFVPLTVSIVILGTCLCLAEILRKAGLGILVRN